MRRSNSSSYLLLCLFGLPFAAVGMVVGYFMFSMIYNSQRMASWPVVDAEILSADLDQARGSKSSTTYQVKATYRYIYKNQSYSGDRVSLSFGSDNIGSFHEQKYNEIKRYLNQKKPFPVHVNPENPSAAILFPEIRWELLAFEAVFVAIFGTVGFGILIGGLIGLRSSREKRSLAAKHPEEPWHQRPDWNNRRLPSTSKTTLIVATVVAVVWNGVSLPVLFAAPKELSKGNYWIAVFLIFPIIGGFLIYFAARTFFRWRRFGGAALFLDTLPAWIGESFKGRITTGGKLPDAREVEVVLTCQETVTRRSGGKSTTNVREISRIEKKFPVRPSGTSADEQSVSVDFDIPSNLPGSSDGDDSRQISWKLSASAKLSGADFEANFEVPIYSKRKN